MRYVLFSVVLLLTGQAAAVQADEVPEPFRSLAGTWQRPMYGVSLAKDGKTEVVPQIGFYANDHPRLKLLHGPLPSLLLDHQRFAEPKNWSLVVGGGPLWSYRNVLSEQFVRFHITAVEDKKGELVVSAGDNQVRFEYQLEDGFLTIECKEPLPAGRFLEKYNISGHWERPPQTIEDIKASHNRWMRLSK